MKGIRENLEGTPGLEVKVLLDYARGSRGENNSRTMLTPLMQSPEQSCQVKLWIILLPTLWSFHYVLPLIICMYVCMYLCSIYLHSTSQVFLYHTPTLRGVRKKILPQRWNELIGLQHMKVYIFDDSVLITGYGILSRQFTCNSRRRNVILLLFSY